MKRLTKPLAIALACLTLASSLQPAAFSQVPVQITPADRQKLKEAGSGVLLVRDAGKSTFYRPTADTDSARGTALMSAVAAAVSGEVIVLGPGNYLENATASITPADGVHIRGAGSLATKIYRTANVPELFYIGDGGSASDITFDHQGTGATMEALLVAANDTVRLDNVRCISADVTAASLWLYGGATADCTACVFNGPLHQAGNNSTLRLYTCLVNGDDCYKTSAGLGTTFESYDTAFVCAAPSNQTAILLQTSPTSSATIIGGSITLSAGTGAAISGSSAALVQNVAIFIPSTGTGILCNNVLSNYTVVGGRISGTGTHLSQSAGTLSFGGGLVYDPTKTSGTLTPLNGFMTPPRLTTVEINALPTWTGRMAYDTDLNVMKFWNGSVWKTITTD